MDGAKRNAIGAGVITLTDLVFPLPALRWFGDLPKHRDARIESCHSIGGYFESSDCKFRLS